MKWRYLVLAVLVLLPVLESPASAGIIFGKRKKPNPAERVPELVRTVESDGDERRRMDAAEELRSFDASAYPQIIPTLIRVLMTDQKAAVRAEAAQTLGRIRPISQEAGRALEYARDNDSSMRVRLQARSSLLSYHWNGYRSGTGPSTPQVQSKEPPLAGPGPATGAGPRIAMPPPPPPTQGEPPLAAPPVAAPAVAAPVLQPSPKPALQPVPGSSIPVVESSPGFRPLPEGPAEPISVPREVEGPSLAPPPGQ